jgi:hypothetical protein
VNLLLLGDDSMQREPDISFAREKLSWKPLVSVEQRLAKNGEYFERRFNQSTQAGTLC